LELDLPRDRVNKDPTGSFAVPAIKTEKDGKNSPSSTLSTKESSGDGIFPAYRQAGARGGCAFGGEP